MRKPDLRSYGPRDRRRLVEEIATGTRLAARRLRWGSTG